MRYEKQTILTSDRNPNGGEDYETAPFFVACGEDGKYLIAAEWQDRQYAGFDSVSLHPAYSTDAEFAEDEGRCWYRCWTWSADEGYTAEGYTAEGYGSCLLTFREGVGALVKAGKFEFPAPPDEMAEAA